MMTRKSNKGMSTMYAAIGMVMLIIAGFAAGYYLRPVPETAQEFPEDSAWRTGSISLAGSTTVLPIAEACSVAFMNKYSGTSIIPLGGGSGVGYRQIIDQIVDIGLASRPPKPTEIQAADLWLHPVALDAVCLVVHPTVNASLKLTLHQVGRIFAGNYTRWNQVNPSLPDAEIYVVVREEGSGTRGTFEEYTMDPWGFTVDTERAHEQPSNPAVRGAVETTSYSIGYVGFGFLSNNMVHAALAKTEGAEYVLPTLANIQGGRFPISRFVYFVTGSPPASGSLADRFIDFVLSPEGQEIVGSKGFLQLPPSYNYP